MVQYVVPNSNKERFIITNSKGPNTPANKTYYKECPQANQAPTCDSLAVVSGPIGASLILVVLHKSGGITFRNALPLGSVNIKRRRAISWRLASQHSITNSKGPDTPANKTYYKECPQANQDLTCDSPAVVSGPTGASQQRASIITPAAPPGPSKARKHKANITIPACFPGPNKARQYRVSTNTSRRYKANIVPAVPNSKNTTLASTTQGSINYSCFSQELSTPFPGSVAWCLGFGGSSPKDRSVTCLAAHCSKSNPACHGPSCPSQSKPWGV